MTDVLIVDDSATARQVLRQVLSADEALHVVGVAKDGREAVEMTRKLKPDVITMDINMPRMDGFEATKQIMIETPTPIVIVSISTRIQDVATGMQALRAGALTLVRKPTGPASPDFESTAYEVVSLVKAMADVKVVRHHRNNAAVARPKDPPPIAPKRTKEQAGPMKKTPVSQAVAIVSSTGGPPALNTIFSALPSDFPPILLVQHIADGFVGGFVAWLNGAVPLTIKLAEEGERLEAGTVYVAPHDRHLGVSLAHRIQLTSAPPIGGFRPAGTFLIESAVSAFGDQLTAVILTGMGSDGVDGLRSVQKAGGYVVAQDEETSVVYGMPKAAIAEGLTDSILPVDQIAPHLLDSIERH